MRTLNRPIGMNGRNFTLRALGNASAVVEALTDKTHAAAWRKFCADANRCTNTKAMRRVVKRFLATLEAEL